MLNTKRLLIFQLVSFFLIVLFSFLGLILNISTVSLNEKINTINSKLKKLKQENKILYLEITEKTSYENLEALAEYSLKLRPYKKINYIIIDKKE
ncbi:hypothetical protein ACFL2K_04460 [Candidatus Margulisiibacteriota bacterium]